jgi:hypothetical protein
MKLFFWLSVAYTLAYVIYVTTVGTAQDARGCAVRVPMMDFSEQSICLTRVMTP